MRYPTDLPFVVGPIARSFQFKLSAFIGLCVCGFPEQMPIFEAELFHAWTNNSRTRSSDRERAIDLSVLFSAEQNILRD